jgi:phosphatidylethanolamine/phosphatidyl-N-methylethanolamine N-methyltransferase
MNKLAERSSPKDEEITDLDLDRRTAATKARYDRIAPFYDLMEWATEHSAFQAWREDLWSRVPPGQVLEVGVGTGKNMPYYPEGARVTAIDLSERMLAQAERRAKELGIGVDLRPMDAQDLDFPDDTFDAAVATFVFCSVPIPVRGLRELGRVVKPLGDIWLLEHVRINKPVIGPLMDVMNPVVVRIMGANINRQTVENVKRAGLEIVGVEDLRGELVKLIHARP